MSKRVVRCLVIGLGLLGSSAVPVRSQTAAAAGDAAAALPALRPTPHLPVPGVVYLEEIGEEPLLLRVIEDVWAQVTPDPRTRVDFLPAGREVRVLGIGERMCWIQGQALRGPVVGWVPTTSLQPVPPERWRELFDKQRRIEQQRQLVEEGRIAVGMTMDQVRDAFGRPDETEMEATAAGETVRWYYHEYERQHVYLPGAYVAGMAVSGGYWTTQRMIEASLIVTFTEGKVGRIERKVFHSPARFNGYETWAPYGVGGSYGFVSRWPTVIVGDAVPMMAVEVPRPGPPAGVQRPTARGGERVDRLFGSGGIHLVQPQAGQPMTPPGSVSAGTGIPLPNATQPRGERPGASRGGRQMESSAGQGVTRGAIAPRGAPARGTRATGQGAGTPQRARSVQPQPLRPMTAPDAAASGSMAP